jgi:hypothetical protein
MDALHENDLESVHVQHETEMAQLQAKLSADFQKAVLEGEESIRRTREDHQRRLDELNAEYGSEAAEMQAKSDATGILGRHAATLTAMQVNVSFHVTFR